MTDAANPNQLPFVAVTMGDGAGVGPEVVVAAALDPQSNAECRPVIIGDALVTEDERLQVRPRDLAEIEPAEHGIAELQKAEAEPVPPVRRHVLDEPRGGERREEPRDRARIDPRSPRDLVRPELRRAVRERIEDRECALDGRDMADRGLSRPGHGVTLSCDSAIAFPLRQ